MHPKKRKRLSKFLSLVLRHAPEKAAVRLDEGGWVAVSALLEGCRKVGRPIRFHELKEVIDESDKPRFELSPDATAIRARYGHSVRVALDDPPATPPPTLYHGTAGKYAASIEKHGLHSGGRQYVHLSGDHETAIAVGRRHGKPVVFLVDAGAMHANGHPFYRSGEGIWLTDHVPPGYLVRVE